ncbi:MAG: type II toxin-antitoxin system RelE/ParE family toxin [Angelakisella sp.]|jgi:toxin ParE1/3/4|nr:type II toxin-antitoxin system RelE/ParE family toxin [Angelakisella sp.]
MGQNYKVKLYPTAEQDLLDIINDLNTLSSEVALQYYDLLTEQIASLSSMPERCARSRDLILAAKGYRYLILKKYLVFFIVAEDTVQIHRILYGRSDYRSIL